MDDTEHVVGAVPAGTEHAQAARWAFYASLRRSGAAECVPDQLIHCFNHRLDRSCVCGRVKALTEQ